MMRKTSCRCHTEDPSQGKTTEEVMWERHERLDICDLLGRLRVDNSIGELDDSLAILRVKYIELAKSRTIFASYSCLLQIDFCR